MNNTLFLRLEGPLQAYGDHRALREYRHTFDAPSKSAVVGLLACALGARGAALVELCASLRMGVRVDRPGAIYVDFQVVTGGVPRADTGKVKGKIGQPERVVQYVYYLADSSFLVALQGEGALIERLARALPRPVWPYYLGRRACVPSRTVFAGVGQYADLHSALSAWPYHVRDVSAETPESPVDVRAIIECVPGAGRRVHDVALSHEHRRFGPRYVEDVTLRLEVANAVSDAHQNVEA